MPCVKLILDHLLFFWAKSFKNFKLKNVFCRARRGRRIFLLHQPDERVEGQLLQNFGQVGNGRRGKHETAQYAVPGTRSRNLE
jgi:hypothetical protein